MNPQPSFLTSSLCVLLGGGVGSWLRFAVGRTIGTAHGFPWATLTVNVVGSFAMGLLAGWLAWNGGETWRLLLGVGVLGGFTTFSAFSLDFAQLVQRGAWGTAAVYVAVSLLASFVGLFAGLMLMRSPA